jgi:hypothetical protein
VFFIPVWTLTRLALKRRSSLFDLTDFSGTYDRGLCKVTVSLLLYWYD